MTDERLSQARKALARFEDRNSRPNPAHLADALRGLIALVEEAHAATSDEREVLRRALRERGEGSVYSDALAGDLSRALRAARSEG